MSERPIWAPWRIEYITGPKDGECIFCAAASSNNTDPAHTPIDRTEHCLTILNAYPYAPGHVMVAPLRHIGALEDLAGEEMLDTMRLARRAILAIGKAMAPEGFNVGFNLGKVAGAGIADHLHLHVVPRWSGDTNFMPVLAETNVIPQALGATRDVLVDALAGVGDG
ncbi:MAG: HIT domain-containing protein [Solirubrobacterales bacterium]|nr:HIT domain-containing protein [Solirubrobacterales bacterium]MBV9806888.1 HIT domain-containing protein [Solirubrobacterales bacterium]